MTWSSSEPVHHCPDREAEIPGKQVSMAPTFQAHMLLGSLNLLQAFPAPLLADLDERP